MTGRTTLTSVIPCMQADVFDIASWQSQLQGAVGVISCLGAFGSNDFMQKICGDSNITVFNEAAKAGVSRAAFISVHDYGLPGKCSYPSGPYCPDGHEYLDTLSHVMLSRGLGALQLTGTYFCACISIRFWSSGWHAVVS